MVQERIIQYLKSNKTFVSGQKLSRHLKISRAAVWKHVRDLRLAGYKIEAVPHRGYYLKSCPDKLLPEEIFAGLATERLGRTVYYYETISSTMDEAFRLAAQGSPEGTLVCAESQTRGRGRLGRTWISPKGKGLYTSLILRPDLSPLEVGWITFVAAIAVCETVREATGLKAAIKWPNDVLIGGRKVAGILTEMNAETDRVKFVIVGLGMNVNADKVHLPPRGTSLKMESGNKVSRICLLQNVLQKTEYWYGCLQARDFSPVIERWKALSITIGRRIRLSEHHRIIEGKAVDLSAEGGLVILNEDGDLITRMTGDVELI